MLARPGPRVFKRVALRDELSGTHRDPLADPAIQRGLGFLRLSYLAIHATNGISVLHDLSKGTNAPAGNPAVTQYTGVTPIGQ